MNEVGLEWVPYVTLGTVLVCVILLIVVIAQGSRIRKLQKRYSTWVNGTEVENLEQLIMKMQLDIEGLQLSKEQHQSLIEVVQRKQKVQISNVGMLRYNAFEERGSDLSFSIALLNDVEDGVVFTGIHGREHTYVYAKPVEKGQSTYTLSPEEKKAMEAAKLNMTNAK